MWRTSRHRSRSKLAKLSLLLLTIASIVSTAFSQEIECDWKLAPNEVSEIRWPGLDTPIAVRLPASWSPAKNWPVLFYYHGTGGRTTISLPVNYTGGDHFVIVGMTYSVKGSVKAEQSAEFYRDTVRNFEEVKDYLAKVVSVDPQRAYVGGFSKGGWTAAYFADKHPNLIAGAIILGAGVNPYREAEKTPLPRLKEGTPVYVGVGQLEFNYAVSLQSVKHYGGRGARVTFDVYDGLGHRPATDPKSEYLVQWLMVEARRDNIKELKPAFDAWLAKLQERVAATSDPVIKYLLLERAGNAPFAKFLNKSQRNNYSAQLEALKKLPEVAAEWKLRSRYESTRRTESDGGFRLANWEAVILDYTTVYRRGPETTFGKRAGLDALRVLESIREAVRQRTKAGRATGEFLEQNQRLIAELENIPRPKLVEYFTNLRQTLTVSADEP